MKINDIPDGKKSIEDLLKIMTTSSHSDQKIRSKLMNNNEAFSTAKVILDTNLDKSVESNVLNTLQNLESWMRQNHLLKGAIESFIALRVLNTHLIIKFSERYIKGF